MATTNNLTLIVAASAVFWLGLVSDRGCGSQGSRRRPQTAPQRENALGLAGKFSLATGEMRAERMPAYPGQVSADQTYMGSVVDKRCEAIKGSFDHNRGSSTNFEMRRLGSYETPADQNYVPKANKRKRCLQDTSTKIQTRLPVITDQPRKGPN